MEEHRDARIACADCGASFVFSAAEAAVFAERGLTAPKRCKDCRRARKERGPTGGARGSSGHAGGGGYGAPTRGGRPRYTGDVNEYRSPMQDGPSAASHHAGVLTGSTEGRGVRRGTSEHRGPMQDRGAPRATPRLDARRPRGDGPPRQDGPRRGPPSGHGAPSGRAAQNGSPRSQELRSSEARPPRKQRAPSPKFAITCNACGAQAEVPFQPAEGREVFCGACYRARRPPVAPAEG